MRIPTPDSNVEGEEMERTIFRHRRKNHWRYHIKKDIRKHQTNDFWEESQRLD